MTLASASIRGRGISASRIPCERLRNVNTSTDHSNPFKVVVQGTGPDRVLKVVAG
jgi:hypothetical protein